MLPPSTPQPAITAVRYDYNKYTDEMPQVSRVLLSSRGIMPCSQGAKHFRGNTLWQGMAVQSWFCYPYPHTEKSSRGIKQYYSPDWQLVVLEEHADGSISEMRQISPFELKHESFLLSGEAQPLRHYQRVVQ